MCLATLPPRFVSRITQFGGPPNQAWVVICLAPCRPRIAAARIRRVGMREAEGSSQGRRIVIVAGAQSTNRQPPSPALTIGAGERARRSLRVTVWTRHLQRSSAKGHRLCCSRNRSP